MGVPEPCQHHDRLVRARVGMRLLFSWVMLACQDEGWLELFIVLPALLCVSRPAGDVGVKLRVSDAGEVSVEMTA